MFASLQSDIGKEIIKKHNIDSNKIDSILLYDHDEGISYKSSAALKIASMLNMPTRLLIVFFIVPVFIRNWIYDFIARNRYKWYGKTAHCMIPTPEIIAKFII